MFSQACVKNSVHGGVYTPSTPRQTPSPLQADTPGQILSPLGRHPLGRPPPPSDAHCSGRYASYWNAFMFKINSLTLCHFIRLIKDSSTATVDGTSYVLVYLVYCQGFTAIKVNQVSPKSLKKNSKHVF